MNTAKKLIGGILASPLYIKIALAQVSTSIGSNDPFKAIGDLATNWANAFASICGAIAIAIGVVLIVMQMMGRPAWGMGLRVVLGLVALSGLSWLVGQAVGQ